MAINRRKFVTRSIGYAIAANAGNLLASKSHANEPFPNRPITLIVPWTAGGATDITLRILAEQAGAVLGARIIVENKAGASGSMAMPVLLNAPPDGYVIAQLPHPVLRLPHTTKVAWDPIRDTTPIIQLSGVYFGIVVPQASAFKTLADVLDWGRAHPGMLSVSTNGVSSTPHLLIEDLAQKMGVSYVHVPYKGTAEQMLAVAAGHVMVGINSSGFGPYVERGQLRLLATTGEQRAKRWLQTPTLRELGHPIIATSPYGLVGPKALPLAIVQTLHDAFRTALYSGAHVAELAKFDQEPLYLGANDYGAYLREAFANEKRVAERLAVGRQ